MLNFWLLAKICFWNKNFFLLGADNIVDLWILLFFGGIGWNDTKYGISHAPILRKCIGNTNKSFWCQGWVQKIVQAVWSIPEKIKFLIILMEISMALKIAKMILMRTYQCRSLSSLSSCSDGDEEAFRTNGTVYPTGEGSNPVRTKTDVFTHGGKGGNSPTHSQGKLISLHTMKKASKC